MLLRLKEEYRRRAGGLVNRRDEPAHPVASRSNSQPANAQLPRIGSSELGVGNSFAEHVERAFGSFGASASMRGRAVPMMLAALSTYHAGMPQVVIVGEPGAPDARALARVVHRRYMPSAVIVPISGAHRASWRRLLPWTAPLVKRNDPPPPTSAGLRLPDADRFTHGIETQLATWNSR